MKGFNISSFTAESDAVELCRIYASLGCDSIRYQFNPIEIELLYSRPQYLSWLQENVARLIRIANQVHHLNLKIILDLHATYGGVSESTREHYIITEDGGSKWAADLIYITNQIINIPNIIGIEPVNEPHCKPIKWRNFLENNKPYFNMIAQAGKECYISTPYGSPAYLQRIPKLGGRSIVTTAHVWPPCSLRYSPAPEDEKYIKSDKCFQQIKLIRQHEKQTRRRVLLGEIGCLAGVGLDLQKLYLKKVLAYAVKEKMHVFMHGEWGNPVYSYEQNGILDVVRAAFK